MNYESTFIVSPELQIEKVEQLIAKTVKVVETSEGTVKTVQQLGKKRLAYSINKVREGIYIYMELSGTGEMVNALENFFKFNDSVIRFMTIKSKKNIVKPALRTETLTLESQIVEVKQNEPAAE
ncbi:MAG: 30S ribosomal protein S6 [Endomicrobium sp.]|jgi:small subunit ribosomal protein S6|nr:30S ribosomal protein S6 [Endomicrobium sp.]